MIFLEFVCRRVLGRPVSGSCWRCPFCDSSGPSFYVRARLGKFKCFRCGAWGDEHDLLKHVEGIADYGARCEFLARLRVEFERGQQVATPPQAPAFSFLGAGSSHPAPAPAYDPNGPVSLAWANLQQDLGKADISGEVALQVLLLAQDAGAPLDHLTHYWLDLRDWCALTDQQHLEECTDADCDARVCRAARGLPPLSKEEIEAGRRQWQAKRQRNWSN